MGILIGVDAEEGMDVKVDGGAAVNTVVDDIKVTCENCLFGEVPDNDLDAQTVRTCLNPKSHMSGAGNSRTNSCDKGVARS